MLAASAGHVAGARSLHAVHRPCMLRTRCGGSPEIGGGGESVMDRLVTATAGWEAMAGRLAQSRGSRDGDDFRLLVYRTGYRDAPDAK